MCARPCRGHRSRDDLGELPHNSRAFLSRSTRRRASAPGRDIVLLLLAATLHRLSREILHNAAVLFIEIAPGLDLLPSAK